MFSGSSSRRAAARQLLWLGALAAVMFTGLLLVLGWFAGRTGGGAGAAVAVDVPGKAISLAYQFEPPQLDSTKATDVYSTYVLGHVMEGLLRADEYGRVVPGVAASWDIRPEGATFQLRGDSRWSDGKPVTAHDFVFAWRKVVDPANASEYAFIMYSVKNAEAINAGKLPPESLGAVAVDDRTLEVKFERPVPYFEQLAVFKTYYPIRQDFYESRGGRYGADAADLLFNGPFVLARWVHGASFLFTKNPDYWNKDTIRIERVDHPYITGDTTAILNLYKDGQVAMAGQSLGLEADQLDEALAQRWPIHRFNEGSVWYLEFNHRQERLTRNFHLRKALQLTVNTSELVNQVIKLPGYLAGKSLFPTWLRGAQGFFQQEQPAPAIKPDLDEARQHLAIAKQELGLNVWPPLDLLLTDLPLNVMVGEYLQRVFKEQLGLDVRLDRQITKQRLAKMAAGEFDLVYAGWSPDFDDPLTFGDLFASWNLSNRGRYDNPELDRHVRTAMNSLDPPVRMQAFGDIQRILLEDAAIAPLYERGQVFVSDKRLKGVVRRVVGTDPDFTYAYLEE